MALLDFRMDVTLDGETLSATEIAALLAGTDGLVLLRGQWVEIDREQLRALDRSNSAKLEQLAGTRGSIVRRGHAAARGRCGSRWRERCRRRRLVAGDGRALACRDAAQLRSPDGRAGRSRRRRCSGTLRPYQHAGVQWLHLLSGLGLGACLADDMGLGKTIQVLSLLLARSGRQGQRGPSLLVAPASLLANWAAEMEQFAPGPARSIVHPSAMPRGRDQRIHARTVPPTLDLVITSYGSLLRIRALAEIDVAAMPSSTRRRRSRTRTRSRPARRRR